MEIDERYLAGFFDGEGCVSICRAAGVRNSHYTVQCSITNTHLPTLQMVKTFFGGNLYSEKNVNTKSKAHWRNKHKVVWAGHNKAKDFLTLIRPYVITKRDQLDFMFELYFPYYENNLGTKGIPVPEEVKAHRETLAKLLSGLKRIEYAIPETKITNNKTI